MKDRDLRGRLRYAEPMARHCTFRVGGAAERYFEPADVDDLQTFFAGLPADEPLTWIGFGSNLLVRDGGIAGTVIGTAALAGLAQSAGDEFRIEAGAACARAARETARLGFAGAEFMAGIPGSVGGALAMNAGAWGADTWSLVRSVETIDGSGMLHRREPAEYRIGYRSVHGPAPEWFVAATLKLAAADAAQCQRRIRDLLDQRAATQPVGRPNCGSVFRNPAGDHAGRLIETAGLKGHAIGGCRVSDKHANFIINDDHASAADIEALIAHVQRVVHQHAGVLLEPEVRIVGRPPGEADNAR